MFMFLFLTIARTISSHCSFSHTDPQGVVNLTRIALYCPYTSSRYLFHVYVVISVAIVRNICQSRVSTCIPRQLITPSSVVVCKCAWKFVSSNFEERLHVVRLKRSVQSYELVSSGRPVRHASGPGTRTCMIMPLTLTLDPSNHSPRAARRPVDSCQDLKLMC